MEWYEEAYYNRRPKEEMLDLGFMSNCFKLEEVLYAGVDGVTVRVKCRAIKEGIVPMRRLGLEIQVKKGHTVNEIKRLGYLKDREAPLEVRLGDLLIVYISKSTA